MNVPVHVVAAEEELEALLLASDRTASLLAPSQETLARPELPPAPRQQDSEQQATQQSNELTAFLQPPLDEWQMTQHGHGMPQSPERAQRPNPEKEQTHTKLQVVPKVAAPPDPDALVLHLAPLLQDWTFAAASGAAPTPMGQALLSAAPWSQMMPPPYLLAHFAQPALAASTPARLCDMIAMFGAPLRTQDLDPVLTVSMPEAYEDGTAWIPGGLL